MYLLYRICWEYNSFGKVSNYQYTLIVRIFKDMFQFPFCSCRYLHFLLPFWSIHRIEVLWHM